MANIKQTVKLGVFTLAIMNVTAVVSLRGLPAEAVYGMSSAFYYLFAAIVFLIPTSLVAAELAAMFQDKQGGVFRWVGEAYGKKLGFLAIWVQWIESTIWYPTVLTFGAVSIAFIGMNDVHDMSLANNKYYTPCNVDHVGSIRCSCADGIQIDTSCDYLAAVVVNIIKVR